jgi:hypothetical protein
MNKHLTEPVLRRQYPAAYADGFAQGENPLCGNPSVPYHNPYAHGTPEDLAWRAGNWSGFCRAEEAAHE